ncbi:MAG: cyanophycinase, partial [Candidatus Natronoplasma sp.]
MSKSKGLLMTIGGNISQAEDSPILKEFCELTRGGCENEPVIAILPTASQEPEKSAGKYSEIFKKLGAETVIIDPENRAESNDKNLIKKASEADAFFFTGGNQLRITTLLGGTEILKTIRERHEEGALIAGTSAGSVCMADLMISYGESENALMTGVVELTRGLGFLSTVVLDTHFTARGRFPRLVHVVVENPVSLGIGLGEDTAAVWDLEKNEFRVIGSRSIV